MEPTLRKILLILGIVAVLAGLAGLALAWPPGPQTGALVTVLGAVMIWLGRRTT